jgi:hypothetical protein
MEMKIKLSTLWVVVMFNYLYADVTGFYAPGMIEGIIAGDVGGLQLTQAFLLGSAVLMEIPIVMVLLSRTLKYRANRWANIITGTIYIWNCRSCDYCTNCLVCMEVA